MIASRPFFWNKLSQPFVFSLTSDTYVVLEQMINRISSWSHPSWFGYPFKLLGFGSPIMIYMLGSEDSWSHHAKVWGNTPRCLETNFRPTCRKRSDPESCEGFPWQQRRLNRQQCGWRKPESDSCGTRVGSGRPPQFPKVAFHCWDYNFGFWIWKRVAWLTFWHPKMGKIWAGGPSIYISSWIKLISSKGDGFRHIVQRARCDAGVNFIGVCLAAQQVNHGHWSYCGRALWIQCWQLPGSRFRSGFDQPTYFKNLVVITIN